MAQLNDLLVVGSSKFLNEINGKIDWLNINNKPTIIGTVTQVKVGSTTYDPTSGVISLPAYPSVPVTSVAGKTGAVTLTASDVGALASTTKYAGASTAGGSATSAAKLDTTTAGSATQPCYFSNGVPSACTYSLNKTVPSDAVFTDTNNAVTQTATSTDSNYEVLFSNSANDTTETAGVRKDSGFLFNPSRDALTVGNRKSGTTVANGSIALGYDITASGIYSYAQGYCTSATNYGAHAEGASTIASGNYAHAEGTSTTASGNYAHSEGYYTIANHKSQHVFGEYNLEDASTETSNNRGNYIEIVGNGTSSSARSNARTLDWNGNEWLAGGLESSYFVANRTYSTDSTRSDTTEIAGGYAHFINRYDSGTRVYQLNLSGIDIELNNGTWDGSNTSLKDAFQHTPYVDTSGTYPWLKAPGNVANWIKVGSTSSTNYFGIIPAQAGGLGSGHSSVGTSDYAFSQCYIDNFNGQKIALTKNGVTTTISSENNGYVHFACGKPFSFDNSVHLTGTNRDIGSTRYRCSNIYTNAVNSAGNVICKGNMTAGYAMHGNGTGHTYACEWGSNLAFWVDVTKVATVSDRRLKHDIEEVNWDLVRAIAECKTYQYKAFNRNGLISVGIIAQDLVANCEKYGIDPLEYELLDMEQFIADDSTLYYHLEYEQYLTFKSLWLQHQIDELKELIENK